MHQLSLNQVTFSVTNIDRSYNFYKELGLFPIVKSDHYARFIVPGNEATLSIHVSEKVRSTTTIYFEVNDVYEVYNELIEKGFDFRESPADQRWQWREAYLEDPDGNQICIYHAGEIRMNPEWRLDESKERHLLTREHFKEWLDVRKELRTSISPYNATCYNFYLGLVDLKEGQFDSARSKLDIIQSHLPDITSNKDMAEFYHDFLLGELLLAEDSVEEAISTSKEASSIGAYSSMYVSNLLPHNFPFERDTLARAYLKVGDIDKAIVEYERLITFDPNTLERSLIHPRYYYKLGKLYEQKGQKAKAIEHYEKFLDLWKDADPGIFEVEDARKRLMGLTTNQ